MVFRDYGCLVTGGNMEPQTGLAGGALSSV
jgi:hypothetical protein